jgi:beta-N-acetylhexosaminidase
MVLLSTRTNQLFCLLWIFFAGLTCSHATQPPFLSFMEDEWVLSELKELTLEEKIGQLIMVTAYPNQGEIHKQALLGIIKKYKPGGVLIMEGSPHRTASLFNALQKASPVPLLIAVDGETGLGFRLDSAINYPPAQALGAVNNVRLLYDMGIDIGSQCKEAGIHINFAPVADINIHPDHPVINSRSFGENPLNVAAKATAFSRGLQDAGILAVAKHFPGHGDTYTDSHQTLPTLYKSKKSIDSMEAYPFKELIHSGVGGIMTGHLHVSAFDSARIPASLSSNIIRLYLRESLAFEGLVITDAMNMKGVGHPPGTAELMALKAGNDMVEFVPDLENTLSTLRQALRTGALEGSEIEQKCQRVLALKRWCGLDSWKPTDPGTLANRINQPLHEVRLRKLIESSLTVLTNNHVLPLAGLDTLKIASVAIGVDTLTPFQKMLGKYTEVEHFTISKNASPEALIKLRNDLRPYNLVLAGILGVAGFPAQNYGITANQREAARIVSSQRSVFVFFGNAYALRFFDHLEKTSGLVMAYEASRLTQELSAQLLFGAIDASGRLPVTINEYFKEGDGLPVKNTGRLKYTLPEETGISSRKLTQRIDSIANLGIDSMAYPGCQVLIAHKGKVIFHKCYGFLTYKKEIPVSHDLIYDWASVTKITGPLPALMKLNAEGKFDLDKPLSTYWPDFIGSNKETIKIRDILAHQGRLQDWIPYWRSTLKRNGKLKSTIFRTSPVRNFSFRVSSKLYMNWNYRKNIFDAIRESPLLKKKEYVYSDLGFYLFPSIISSLTGRDYETYLKETFYHPLGAYTILYNPYICFPTERIVPTEYDDFFRSELLQGYVHDEGAAMMGGVSGHAGLFGTANDLAKLMQMYLQKGWYGAVRYLPEETVNEFTRCQFPENDNRRGLGFDKPYIDNHKKELKDAYPAVDASENSFGHSGYTGIFTWADPDNQLLYIFFSNRVYPTRENSRLFDLNIRPAMHQAIYDCIKEGCLLKNVN